MSAPADGLYSHLQSLRIDQVSQSLGLSCQARSNMHRASSESPFAEPLTSSSAGGDVQSDNSSAEPSLHDGPALHHSPSQPMPQTQSMVHDDFTSRPSLDGQAKSSQICFDYTKGLCTRGDKCKYSHDLATIVHFNSKEKGICFDYLRNQCHRGLLCRFSHDLSNIAQQCQGSDVSAHHQAQQVFSNTLGKGKTNAICYDFVKGVCQRGNDCRYSHDLSLIARTARGGQQNQKSTEICYDYLRGRCNRGNGCKYSHNISFLATPSFLSTSLSGAASTGSTGAGGPPPPAPTSVSLGGALPGAMSNPGAMMGSLPGQRLSPSISADPLSLAINSSISASLSPDLDNHTLNASLSSDIPDLPSDGQPWSAHGGGAMPAAAVHALAVAAQRRQYAAAAAAAQLSSYNQLQQAMQMAGMDMNGVANGYNAAQQQSLASTLAAAQQQAAARAYLANQQNEGPPGLNRAQSAPLGKLASTPMVAESITTLLANLGDNPQLLAETLSGLAAAAQAQAAARMSAPGLSNGGSVSGVSAHSAPQSIPGCFESGSGVPSPPFGSFADGCTSGTGPLLPSMSAPAPEHHAATAPRGAVANNLTAAALSPDLLPLIKEIWNK